MIMTVAHRQRAHVFPIRIRCIVVREGFKGVVAVKAVKAIAVMMVMKVQRDHKAFVV